MSDIERPTDSELVAAYVAGDHGAFAGIYDRYASHIFSYALAMLHDRRDAADAAHNTFIEAARRMGDLDEPKDLRPWLFSISREQTRELAQDPRPEAQAPGGDSDEPDLRERVWAATGDLGERDRQLVVLHLTEGLEGDDLALAMGVERSHLPVMVSRMSDRGTKALGPFVAARVANGDPGETIRVLREVLPGILIVPAPPALRPRVLDKVDKGILEKAEREVASTAPPPPPPQPRNDVEWVKYVALAVVALVLGLIGIAVSAQFAPLDPPATVTDSDASPVAAGTTTTAAATTSTTVSPSTTRSRPVTTTSPTRPGAPAAIEASTETIDLGTEGIAGEFELRNTGEEPEHWQLQSSSEAITTSIGQGDLAGGDSTTLEVSLDRETVGEGEFSETIAVSWGDEVIEIAVVGVHEANPIIHNPVASPSSVEVAGEEECQNTQTTVSARIRDHSPLESVVVQWSPNGSDQQETAMVPVGEEMYEAVIGPFSSPHSASARIVAFDERGNAGGASTPISVVACP